MDIFATTLMNVIHIDLSVMDAIWESFVTISLYESCNMINSISKLFTKMRPVKILPGLSFVFVTMVFKIMALVNVIILMNAWRHLVVLIHIVTILWDLIIAIVYLDMKLTRTKNVLTSMSVLGTNPVLTNASIRYPLFH